MSEAVPALAAYTESGQSIGTRGGKKKANAKGIGRAAKPVQPSSFKRRNRSTLDFDEASRHEFLTGFRKRKAARVELARKKREEFKKEERRRARSEAREAKKQRAQENVEAERKAHAADEDGDGVGEDGSGEEDGENSESGEDAVQLQFNDENQDDYQTTVTITEWDPDAARDEGVFKARKNKTAPSTEPLLPSSKRKQKKSKGRFHEAASGPKRSDRSKLSKLPSVNDISSLLETTSHDSQHLPEVTSAAASLAAAAAAAPKEHKFTYETKAERAKVRAKLKERNGRMKEARIQKEKVKRRRGGGGAGRRV